MMTCVMYLHLHLRSLTIHERGNPYDRYAIAANVVEIHNEAAGIGVSSYPVVAVA